MKNFVTFLIIAVIVVIIVVLIKKPDNDMPNTNTETQNMMIDGAEKPDGDMINVTGEAGIELGGEGDTVAQ